MFNIDFNHPIHVHFIGIGGISMSGLARILLDRHFTVSGSDAHESELTDELAKDGCLISYPQSADNITGDIDLVVYTAAIHPDNKELKAAIAAGIPTMTRAELLGQIMKNYHTAVNVAGTHGKTTTTSMITEILLAANADPTISVGGILHSIGGNIRVGSSDIFVTEACEYTNSFLSFNPTLNIILNVKADHLDFFKDIDDIRHSFKLFTEKLPSDGTLVINTDIDNYEYFYQDTDCEVITFGSDPARSMYSAADINHDEYGRCSYTLLINNKPSGTIKLSVPGVHNVYNSLSAIAACIKLGISMEAILKGLVNFTGTDRRFQKKGVFNGITVIDDYAHHPTAIKYVIEETRTRFPGKQIVAVYQPDRYSRGLRFAKDYARIMDTVDHPYFVDFPKNAPKEPGIDIDVSVITKNLPRSKVVTEDEAGAKELAQYDNAVFLFMSPKDIYKLEELVIKEKEKA